MTEPPIYGANQNPLGSPQTQYLSCCLYILPIFIHSQGPQGIL